MKCRDATCCDRNKIIGSLGKLNLRDSYILPGHEYVGSGQIELAEGRWMVGTIDAEPDSPLGLGTVALPAGVLTMVALA